MNITKQAGPFKNSYVFHDGRPFVARVFTQGRGWTVKALDGRRWGAGKGMTTDTKIFETYREAIKFINEEFEATT